MQMLHGSNSVLIIVRAQHPIKLGSTAHSGAKDFRRLKMAYINIDLARGTGNGIIAQFRQFAEAFTTRMIQHRVYRTTVTELNSLSDRELDDLNIGRGEIHRIAAEAAYS